MKTKRADFAAAFLHGRMIVAGGLGKRVCRYQIILLMHDPHSKSFGKEGTNILGII